MAIMKLLRKIKLLVQINSFLSLFSNFRFTDQIKVVFNILLGRVDHCSSRLRAKDSTERNGSWNELMFTPPIRW